MAAIEALVAERPDGDPRALFELASTHDFLGRESDAVPLYRQALAGDLEPDIRAQATVQLASSLRNIGQPDDAVALLERLEAPCLGAAPAAFLALAHHSAGRRDQALAVALRALSSTLPMYARAVSFYADELTRDP